MILKLNIYFYTRHCVRYICVFQKVLGYFFLNPYFEKFQNHRKVERRVQWILVFILPRSSSCSHFAHLLCRSLNNVYTHTHIHVFFVNHVKASCVMIFYPSIFQHVTPKNKDIFLCTLSTIITLPFNTDSVIYNI